jgi:hypothetical protein
MHNLANERVLLDKEVGKLSAQAFLLLVSWAEAGWLVV